MLCNLTRHLLLPPAAAAANYSLIIKAAWPLEPGLAAGSAKCDLQLCRYRESSHFVNNCNLGTREQMGGRRQPVISDNSDASYTKVLHIGSKNEVI